MDEDDECKALRQVLEKRCPGVKFKDNDIEKLVVAGYATEIALAATTRDALNQILPTRPGLVGVLFQTFVQPAEKCTEYDWLCQDLPSWVSEISCKTPNSTHKERMYTPLRVEKWDVLEAIGEYIKKGDKFRPLYKKVEHSIFTTTKRNLVAITNFILNSTCDFVRTKQPGSSVTFDGKVDLKLPPKSSTEGGESTNPDGSNAENREVQKCLFYTKPPRVDVLIESNGKAVSVLELKNGGLQCSVPICQLWKRCSCQTGTDSNCWCNFDISKGHAGSILNCILQLYEYLVLAKVGYGILTDVQNWYLFRRDHDGCLYISEGVKLNGRQPPLCAAIAYLVNSAVDAHGEFDILPTKGERPWTWDVTPIASPSSSSEGDEDKDRTYKPTKRKYDGNRRSPARTRRASSSAGQNQMHEFSASELHLDDRPIYSGGWSGCVVGGTFNGRRVAVKLAPRNSERAEALLNEVDSYLKLQEYWGEFVPSLVGHGTTANGQIVFIAIDLIDGSPLGPGTVTEEVAAAALRALGAVHACNLLHGDVEARNIMVVWGTQPSVRLIDFGFARCTSNRNLQKAELWKLQRLIQDMMGVGVVKESGARYPHEQLYLV